MAVTRGIRVTVRSQYLPERSSPKANQYAFAPHFRADGWIYFVVRTLEGNEYFAASDAALVGEAASP